MTLEEIRQLPRDEVVALLADSEAADSSAADIRLPGCAKRGLSREEGEWT